MMHYTHRPATTSLTCHPTTKIWQVWLWWRRSSTTALALPSTLSILLTKVPVEDAVGIESDLFVVEVVRPVVVLLLLLGGSPAMARTTRFCSRARARVFLRCRFLTMRARMASSSAAARAAASAATIFASVRASAAFILSFPRRAARSWWTHTLPDR